MEQYLEEAALVVPVVPYPKCSYCKQRHLLKDSWACDTGNACASRICERCHDAVLTMYANVLCSNCRISSKALEKQRIEDAKTIDAEKRGREKDRRIRGPLTLEEYNRPDTCKGIYKLCTSCYEEDPLSKCVIQNPCYATHNLDVHGERRAVPKQIESENKRDHRRLLTLEEYNRPDTRKGVYKVCKLCYDVSSDAPCAVPNPMYKRHMEGLHGVVLEELGFKSVGRTRF